MTRRSRRLATGAFVCAISGVLAGCTTSPAATPVTAPADAVAVEVTQVVDGDTVRARPLPGTAPPWTPTENDPVDTDVAVRLVGVDTPEVYPDLECGGAEATDALRSLVSAGDTVWATRDDEERDRYDRVLLYLWTEDGTFVNLELVASGAGEALRIDPNDRYWPDLQAAQSTARDTAAGIWSLCR